MKFSLAGLYHVAEAAQLFHAIGQGTGAQKAADLAQRGAALVDAGSGDLDALAEFNGEIRDYIALFGPLVPGAPLAQIKEKIEKYERDLSVLTGGDPVTVADADVSVSGRKYRLELTLKATPI